MDSPLPRTWIGMLPGWARWALGPGRRVGAKKWPLCPTVLWSSTSSHAGAQAAPAGRTRPPLPVSRGGNRWGEAAAGDVSRGSRQKCLLASETRTGQRETCGAAGHASEALVQVSPKNLGLCRYLWNVRSSPALGSPA